MNLRKKTLVFFALIFCTSSSVTSQIKDQANIYDNQAAVTTNANTIPGELVPVGKSIGITLSLDGVLIANLSEIECTDGRKHSPAKSAGLMPGDIIKKYNNNSIRNVEELTNAISHSTNNTCEVIFLRNDKEIRTSIKPEMQKTDNRYKIGAWVKDAASGIGTLTFYNPQTKSFGALGHGICHQNTNNLMKIREGDLLNSTIVDINKSQKGIPGELKGIFSENDTTLGTIDKNSNCGICGTLFVTDIVNKQPVSVANHNEIKPGKAFIYSNIEGNRVDKFEIEILRVIPRSSEMTKNMIIKITDKQLIEKTGGIVQGMSGSPIIQNDKFVGAITHVFVNDPTRGYGIFIENMLAEAEKIK